MNLYLDDDTVDRRLVAMFGNARHSVVVPAGVDLSGAPDERHFICAIQQSLVLLTRNHDDFLDLHEVVRAAYGSHAGILIIRSDNDPTRDMTLRQIVTAITKLELAELLAVRLASIGRSPGDSNGDLALNVSDVLTTLGYLFLTDAAPHWLGSCG
ncbi:MAG: DUF5615 family PIN-like protein [Planctomycetota bacterium]|nr:DUF5615 family PIN-like protein [Planctomycetota bacterium]